LEPRWQPAAPVNPVYTATFADAVTIDNEFTGADGKHYWTIDSGADQYQNDTYERPTVQTFKVVPAAGGAQFFATGEYYANLDIVEGRAGFDETFLYVSVRMAGLTRHTSDGAVTTEGLVYQYGFRMALEADGGRGLLVVADQPELKNKPNTGFAGLGTFIYRDANGDVGGTGRSVTKQDREAEVGGNGYERVVASDGRTSNGRQVLWVRINPADPTVVEFALDYQAVGLTEADLRALPYLEFEANKGLKGPSSYAWNDEYKQSEAGSPYRATSGDLSKSEFGTQGFGNIYELDTLSGGPITPPQESEGSLSGFVFQDNNGNGLLDAGDTPLSGVTIFLFWQDAEGNAQHRMTTTDIDGSYRFDELAAGTYEIVEMQPFGFLDGPDYVGSLGGNDEMNDQFSEIVLEEGESGENYNFTEGELDE
jgi:hypothetical protein